MILAVDIGNTTISFAIVKRRSIKQLPSVKTPQKAAVLSRELTALLTKVKRNNPSMEAVVVCSVVPSASQAIAAATKKVFRSAPLLIGKDIKVPIKNLYQNPSQVGQDRLVCAYAARELYGVPAIVVDFGTAITFDVISKKGEYQGGAIVPGLRLFAESLFEKTALLPKVTIKHPKGVIGRDTKSSILSGIFYGYSSLCEGMISRISRKLAVKPVIVATGGHSGLIRRHLCRIDRFDKILIFRGLHLIYQKSLGLRQ